MKNLSRMFLLVVALVTLAACDSGKGPSRPDQAGAAQGTAK